MIAKKCDRCSKLYEEYNLSNNPNEINGIMVLNIDCKQSYFSSDPKDLCPECSLDLIAWLSKESEE